MKSLDEWLFWSVLLDTLARCTWVTSGSLMISLQMHLHISPHTCPILSSIVSDFNMSSYIFATLIDANISSSQFLVLSQCFSGEWLVLSPLSSGVTSLTDLVSIPRWASFHTFTLSIVVVMAHVKADSQKWIAIAKDEKWSQNLIGYITFWSLFWSSTKEFIPLEPHVEYHVTMYNYQPLDTFNF